MKATNVFLNMKTFPRCCLRRQYLALKFEKKSCDHTLTPGACSDLGIELPSFNSIPYGLRNNRIPFRVVDVQDSHTPLVINPDLHSYLGVRSQGYIDVRINLA